MLCMIRLFNFRYAEYYSKISETNNSDASELCFQYTVLLPNCQADVKKQRFFVVLYEANSSELLKKQHSRPPGSFSRRPVQIFTCAIRSRNGMGL